MSELSYKQVLKLGRNQFNREIDRDLVNTLKRSIKENGLLNPTIIVNKRTNDILEGQHRTRAYIELVDEGFFSKELPIIKVDYTDVDFEREKKIIITLNNQRKPWSLSTYISSFVNEKNPYYVKLDTFCKKHALTFDANKNRPLYSCGVAFILGKQNNSDLKNGKLNFTDEELERAEIIYSEVVNIRKALNDYLGKDIIMSATLIGLVTAWFKVRTKYSVNCWIETLRKNKHINALKDNKCKNQHDFQDLFGTLLVRMMEKE
jgi:hypothetical protein